MRAIRAVMKLDEVRDLTYWALWASKLQGVMRSSDILRPSDDKARHWDPSTDTHVGRITWEDVEPKENGGCKTRMRWRLKPSKTDPGAKSALRKHFSLMEIAKPSLLVLQYHVCCRKGDIKMTGTT